MLIIGVALTIAGLVVIAALAAAARGRWRLERELVIPERAAVLQLRPAGNVTVLRPFAGGTAPDPDPDDWRFEPWLD